MTLYSLTKKITIYKFDNGQQQIVYDENTHESRINPWNTVLHIEELMLKLDDIRIKLIKEHGINHPNPTLKFDVI